MKRYQAKYSLERKQPELKYSFSAENDSEAIKYAKNLADEIYKEDRRELPKKDRHLIKKLRLEKLVELIPPRKVKIS
jgi:hypothetical protein